MSEQRENIIDHHEHPHSTRVGKVQKLVRWSALALFGGGIILNFAGDHFHRKDLYGKFQRQEQTTKEQEGKIATFDRRIQDLEKQKQTLEQRLDADSKTTSESIDKAIETLRELRNLFDGKE